MPQYDETLTKFGFNFNVRRYTLEPKIDVHMFVPKSTLVLGPFTLDIGGADPCIAKVGRCKLTL
jgi:hypothetical protein